AVGDFTAQFAAALPDDPLAALRALGETHFAALRDYPEARAFWWPRFERIARWFAGFEIARRNDIATVHAEIRGRVELPMGTEAFTLTGRADRIEIGTDGRATIVDYKTGRAPTSTQVQSGISPQLTLEAGMLRRGGFEGVAAGLSVAGLLYVQLRGGEPPGALCPVEFRDNATFDDEAEKAIAQLAKLVAAFADDAMPYRSLVRPQWSKQYGDYDHLARVREWSAVGGMDEPGASG
ncbi:MAG: PD-(D/E)XK nuclease family protein, partial [Rhizobiales bacterium]|nr:PD-(D/E)XK nuclease family protein [Hyphomicrobiales bacterium]